MNSVCSHLITGISLLLLILSSGCESPVARRQLDRLSDFRNPPAYPQPEGYIAPASERTTLHRVGIMPLVVGEHRLTESVHGALSEALVGEIRAINRFEAVMVDPAALDYATGRAVWSAEGLLSGQLVRHLRERYAVEAVLFCSITAYRPYPPLGLGLNLKLVQLSTNANETRIVWAMNEVIDGGRPDVSAAAKKFYREQLRLPSTIGKSIGNLQSPSRFARFCAHTLFQTIPGPPPPVVAAASPIVSRSFAAPPAAPETQTGAGITWFGFGSGQPSNAATISAKVSPPAADNQNVGTDNPTNSNIKKEP